MDDFMLADWIGPLRAAIHARQGGMCHKKRYPDQANAEAHLAFLIGAGRPERYAYRCKRCNDWHLSRSAPR